MIFLSVVHEDDLDSFHPKTGIDLLSKEIGRVYIKSDPNASGVF